VPPGIPGQQIGLLAVNTSIILTDLGVHEVGIWDANFQFTPVPEPATGLLLALGLGLPAVVRSDRARRSFS